MKHKNFAELCYKVLRKVPKGKVTTYKAIAQKLGTKAYRQVGRAMNKNPYGYLAISSEAIENHHLVFRGDSKRTSGFFLVPCHRVVGSNGKLVGFAHGLKKKAEMLKSEGIEIKNGKIDLRKYGFEF